MYVGGVVLKMKKLSWRKGSFLVIRKKASFKKFELERSFL
ncbi:hypothetical protein FUSO4_12545 [Fusobacterium necrophorum DJ-1]|uniref:Uncharacterized protein n=2 Tax=Fusobacterium necrophorum TaxID=859 RepID=A0AB73BUC5_9FUSO|nr:hypothetical protein FUSO4_12545 [Fusobacterium necrophorum DJ-1]KDE61235.1 hypothetical protein FUSO5_12145 [Fusobacterium necrophorum BFTR-1]KDE61983.1 hypothetical protein FUSO3_09355 [Fusobacterium necrophorum BL]KDE68251.1 hypothetical protein FUSO6_09220 [Fusobacterium necrophorum DAB]KDE69468.1 hypothetical protein FUSO8_11455 [Fusobacterium necrophorum DJ-2]KDE74844.1 hypothetical protein FUSO7_00725 [Fusobacterium necrophorum BFTR-2]